MAGSVGPKVGPTWVVVGDAAGSVNPFNGEGIDYAYETGRMVAGLLDEALTTGDGMALQRYPALLDAEYGLYFKVARLFAKVIGNPALMRELTRVGHAVAHAHGVGAADHGQPAPRGRARPRRGRLPGRRRDREATAGLGCDRLRPRSAGLGLRAERVDLRGSLLA